MYIALFWAVAWNFRVPSSWLKIDFRSIFSLFFGFKAILGHEGGTQKFRVTAQDKAIYISFQTSTRKVPKLLVESLTLRYDPMGKGVLHLSPPTMSVPTFHVCPTYYVRPHFLCLSPPTLSVPTYYVCSHLLFCVSLSLDISFCWHALLKSRVWHFQPSLFWTVIVLKQAHSVKISRTFEPLVRF